MTSGLKRTVLIINTLGFLFYLIWLSSFNTSETLRSSDGILFYIPCVPFLFVYMLMLPPKPRPKDKPWWQSDEDYEKEKNAQLKDAAPPPPPPANPTTRS